MNLQNLSAQRKNKIGPSIGNLIASDRTANSN